MPPRRKKSSGRKGAVRKSSSASTFSWGNFLSGVITGIVLSFGGLYLYTSDIEMNFGDGIRNFINNRASVDDGSGKTVSPKLEDPKPVFDFYTVLPEYETVVNEKQFIRETPGTSKKAEKTATYILQAASYKSFKDADMLKAKLALNGLSSRIEKISVEGKGNFYRVRLGPYSSARTKKDVVNRLADLGIKPLHLKVKK
jgi:hypothetical protein